jgi:hypothetical protein
MNNLKNKENQVMKKVFLLVLAFAYCLAGTASMRPDSWVVSENGRVNCKQVHVGVSKARIQLHNGQKIVVPLAEINAYSSDGQVFNKLTLYDNGQPTRKAVFMELVKTRGGYCLYKYYRADIESPHDCYYIYKGDKLCYALDESLEPRAVKNLFGFFGIKACFE